MDINTGGMDSPVIRGGQSRPSIGGIDNKSNASRADIRKSIPPGRSFSQGEAVADPEIAYPNGNVNEYRPMKELSKFWLAVHVAMSLLRLLFDVVFWMMNLACVVFIFTQYDRSEYEFTVTRISKTAGALCAIAGFFTPLFLKTLFFSSYFQLRQKRASKSAARPKAHSQAKTKDMEQYAKPRHFLALLYCRQTHRTSLTWRYVYHDFTCLVAWSRRRVYDSLLDRAMVCALFIIYFAFSLNWVISTFYWERISYENGWRFDDVADFVSYIDALLYGCQVFHGFMRLFSTLNIVDWLTSFETLCQLIASPLSIVIAGLFSLYPWAEFSYLMGPLRFVLLFNVLQWVCRVVESENWITRRYTRVIILAISILVLLLSFAAMTFTSDVLHSGSKNFQFLKYIYFATVTLTTVGYGDIAPQRPVARITTVLVIGLFAVWLPRQVGMILDEMNDEYRAYGSVTPRAFRQKFCLFLGRPTDQQVVMLLLSMVEKSSQCSEVVVLTPASYKEYHSATTFAQNNQIKLVLRSDAFRSSTVQRELLLAHASHASMIIVAAPSHQKRQHRTKKTDRHLLRNLVSLMRICSPAQIETRAFIQFNSSTTLSTIRGYGCERFYCSEILKLALMARGLVDCPGILAVLGALVLQSPSGRGWTHNLRDSMKLSGRPWMPEAAMSLGASLWRMRLERHLLYDYRDFAELATAVFQAKTVLLIGVLSCGSNQESQDNVLLFPDGLMWRRLLDDTHCPEIIHFVAISRDSYLVRHVETLRRLPEAGICRFPSRTTGSHPSAPAKPIIKRNYSSSASLESPKHMSGPSMVITALAKKLSRDSRSSRGSGEMSRLAPDQNYAEQMVRMQTLAVTNKFRPLDDIGHNIIIEDEELPQTAEEKASFAQPNYVVTSQEQAASTVWHNPELPFALICGLPSSIGMFLDNIDSACRAKNSQMNFLIITVELPNEAEIQSFVGHVAVMEGRATSSMALIRAGTVEAAGVAIFNRYLDVEEDDEDEETSVLVVYLRIASLLALSGRDMQVPLVAEIDQLNDVFCMNALLLDEYMKKLILSIGSNYEHLSFSPEFLSGSLFLGPVFDSILGFTSLLSPWAPPVAVLRHLVGIELPRAEGCSPCQLNLGNGGIRLIPSDIPIGKEMTFGDLIARDAQDGILPIGLYRQFGANNSLRYVYMLPSPDSQVISTDMVYVLSAYTSSENNEDLENRLDLLLKKE